jgi:hypothetical protein
MVNKNTSERLAEMQARQAMLAPDFLSAEEGVVADGKPPMLPHPCPVEPMGAQGKLIYFLDVLNQIQASPAEVKKGELKLYFGNDWLEENFPQKDAKGNVVKFNQDTVQTALVEDCRNLGIFNPKGRVFGRGAHRLRGDTEVLVLHLGNRVALVNWLSISGTRQRELIYKPAGRLINSDGDRLYFPAADRLPAPADEPARAEEAADLLAFLGNWYWGEREAGPLLMLGMIMQMFICGALEWRSHVWLAAPTASGKSSLQKVIRAIHEDWCLHTEDASDAAIRQVLMDDTLPVMIDEAEADDRPERMQAIINLMKKASSGAKIYRGGQDHKATEFTAQSCFLLSSVLYSNLKGEDRNRLAILEMKAVPKGARRLNVTPLLPGFRALGRRLRRRVMDHWPRFDDTLLAYQDEIHRRGFAGRWQDTYGTLLACADLALFDHAVSVNTANGDFIPDVAESGPERVARLVALIAPMMAMSGTESRTDVERCMAYLTSQTLPGSHGASAESVGLWIERAMTLKHGPGQFETDPEVEEVDEAARAKLKTHGLRVVNRVKRQKKDGSGLYDTVDDARPEAWGDALLAVAYGSNKPLCDLFRGTEWSDGKWLQSLGKVPGASKAGTKVRFASDANPDYAVLVPLNAFRGDEE